MQKISIWRNSRIAFIRRATASCLWVAVREVVYRRTKLRSELVLSRGVVGVQMVSGKYDHEFGVAYASFTRGVAQVILEMKAGGAGTMCQPMVRNLAVGVQRILDAGRLY